MRPHFLQNVKVTIYLFILIRIVFIQRQMFTAIEQYAMRHFCNSLRQQRHRGVGRF